jgi:hypothetical protein
MIMRGGAAVMKKCKDYENREIFLKKAYVAGL